MAGDRPLPFLDKLRDSGLLTPTQLKELSLLPEARDPDPRALGQQLLKRGWLTRFQINVIVHGRGKELTLGPYVVLDSLGEGAMGQVFKARHDKMGRVVALKVIRKDKLASPSSVQRFYQEVRAAAQLSHPNIVIAYDAGSLGATHYLAMEYVDGVDLARKVKESGPLAIATACDLIRQAAQGLQHAHERGLVHRDIKPSNLLLSSLNAPGSVGTIKILDMGLARMRGMGEKQLGVTQVGAVIGTPDFLAPEQAVDARAADIRSDLYSLGCTFYFLLTGHPPFQAESLTELLLKHQMEQPTPLEQRRPDVPPGVAAIVRRLMAKRPQDRFQTPAEVVNALEPGNDTAAASAPVVLKPVDERDSPWDSLVEDSPASGSEMQATAVLVGVGRTSEKSSGSSTIVERRARPGVSWRALAFVSGGLLAAAITIAAVVFYLGRGTSDTRDESSPAAHAKPAVAPKNEKPPETKHEANEPAISKEQPAADAKQPKPGVEGKSLVVSIPPPAPQAEAPTRTVGEIRRFDRHDAPVTAIVVSADGTKAVTVTDEKSFWIWDVATGKLIGPCPFRFGTPIVCLGLNADASDLRTVAGGSLTRWDLKTFRPTTTAKRSGRFLSSDGAYSLRFDNPNEKPVARLVDAGTGKEIASFANAPADPVSAVIAPECKRFVVGGPTGEIFLGNWGTVKWRKWQIDKQEPVTVTISADGNRIVSVTDALGLCVWDANTGKPLRRLGGPKGSLRGVAISKDGRYVLAGGNDGLVRSWDAESGRLLREFQGHNGAVGTLAFCPDGHHFLSGGADKTMRLWHLSGLVVPRQLAPMDGSVFDHVPRKTTLRWAPVAGAAKYSVEVEFYDPGAEKWRPHRLGKAVRQTEGELEFLFVGRQPGRWRVWAVDDSGLEGPKSPWWNFNYTN
jgi:serine/threonine protein kinase